MRLVTAALSILLAIVLVLVGGRFVALLLGADRSTELVDRLIRHSDFWVRPFFDLFGMERANVEGGGTFEPASLLAFVVYLLFGMLILAVLNRAFYGRHAHA
jgi:hypothetical protein